MWLCLSFWNRAHSARGNGNGNGSGSGGGPLSLSPHPWHLISYYRAYRRLKAICCIWVSWPIRPGSELGLVLGLVPYLLLLCTCFGHPYSTVFWWAWQQQSVCCCIEACLSLSARYVCMSRLGKYIFCRFFYFPAKGSRVSVVVCAQVVKQTPSVSAKRRLVAPSRFCC